MVWVLSWCSTAIPCDSCTRMNEEQAFRCGGRKVQLLLADAEAAEDCVQHLFRHVLPTDFAQGSGRIPQINGPKVERQLVPNALLAPRQGLLSAQQRLCLPLIDRPL